MHGEDAEKHTGAEAVDGEVEAHGSSRLPFAGIQIGAEVMTGNAGHALDVENALGGNARIFPSHDRCLVRAELTGKRIKGQSCLFAILGER